MGNKTFVSKMRRTINGNTLPCAGSSRTTSPVCSREPRLAATIDGDSGVRHKRTRNIITISLLRNTRCDPSQCLQYRITLPENLTMVQFSRRVGTPRASWTSAGRRCRTLECGDAAAVWEPSSDFKVTSSEATLSCLCL